MELENNNSITYHSTINLAAKHVAIMNNDLAYFNKVKSKVPVNQGSYYRCLIEFARLYHKEFLFFAEHQFNDRNCIRK